MKCLSLGVLIVSLGCAACGSTASEPTAPLAPEPVPHTEPEPDPQPAPQAGDRRLHEGPRAERAVCEHGVWIPDVQEPASYVACASDDECVMTSFAGCCSQTWVALRADRVCVDDLGVECARECFDQLDVFPPNAAELGAACVEGTCQLVTAP